MLLPMLDQVLYRASFAQSHHQRCTWSSRDAMLARQQEGPQELLRIQILVKQWITARKLRYASVKQHWMYLLRTKPPEMTYHVSCIAGETSQLLVIQRKIEDNLALCMASIQSLECLFVLLKRPDTIHQSLTHPLLDQFRNLL